MKTPIIALIASTLLFLGCRAATEAPEPQTAPAEAALANGSFTFDADGRAIHYEVHGSGPVVMALTNSWGLSLEGLRSLFEPLTEGLTMVYFDPRGMGSSSPVVDPADMSLAAVREDFHALRKHLGLESVNAIGWSNGATNLILLAAEQPETIDTAIFVHGAASYGPEDFASFAEHYPELAQRYATFQQQMADESLTDETRTEMMRKAWLEEFFPAMTADPVSTAPVIEATFADAKFSWPHARYSQQESPGFDYRDRLGQITARSLVIAGAHDSMPPEQVQEIADGIADAEFVVFPASGHFAPIEEPDAFAATVFDFLGVTPGHVRGGGSPDQSSDTADPDN